LISLFLSLDRLHQRNRHLMDSLMCLTDASGERIAEIAALLADGLLRLRAPKSSDFASECGESSLHISPDQSGDVAEIEGGETA
jgi:hypothetical protein